MLPTVFLHVSVQAPLLTLSHLRVQKLTFMSKNFENNHALPKAKCSGRKQDMEEA
jgi:hypothetical protein